MKPKKPERSETDDLFRLRLEHIIDLKHPLVQLAHETDWSFFEAAIEPLYAEHGRPGVPVRFMVGLHILKHTFNLSDEEVCDRWVENPYYQYFTGEEYFRHDLPHDRSSMTRWRGRVSEVELARLLQESLRIAHKAGALRTRDLRQAIVDTTVQPKAIAFPTDAKLLYRATLRLAKLARRWGVKLRQSYVRVGKLALMKSQRYAHAKQFRRHRREVRFLRTRLDRVIRDIDRKTEGNPSLQGAFRHELALARRVRDQQRRQVGPKVYSLHAPEVECIGKGKPHKPYEFGCKVTVATTNAHAPGGQFVTYIAALHGNPYDGHTLKETIAGVKAITGLEPELTFVDKGYRGHDYDQPMRVYRSGQRRGVTPLIKRRLRRRSAIEPVIGHMKEDGRLGRNFLHSRHGDRLNAILAGVGQNVRLLLRWFELLLRLLLGWLLEACLPRHLSPA
jgi:transposase, IS5 family